MKILFFSHFFWPQIGGIESITEILATQFSIREHEVRVVTWSETESERFFPFRVIRKPSLTRLINQTLWADVIFENNPSLRLSWPSILLLKPNVVVLQTWIARNNGRLSAVDRFKRLRLSASNSVVAISEVVKNEIFPGAQVIPNPFNTSVFAGVGAEFVRRDFVVLGRLVSDKGIDLAIRAIAGLVRQKVDCRLTIIGQGPEMAALKVLAKGEGIEDRVEFLGSLTGEILAAELRKYRYIIIPSRWKEPFGIVALEGLACGCIPIVADGGGLPDAIGKAGLVFKRGDLHDLETKMKYILSDDRLEKQLKAEAPAQLAIHRPEVIADRYLELLKKAAGNEN